MNFQVSNFQNPQYKNNGVMSIYNEEEKLFREWPKEQNNFNKDGIVNEKYYLNSSPKILFLLKEVNSKEGGFDLREFLRDGGRPQTWDNIARWVYGIRNSHREIEWKEVEKIKTKVDRQEQLKSICVINLKKSSGGHTSDNSEVRKYAKEYKKYLDRQLTIYNAKPEMKPNFIIACGSVTSSIFNTEIEFFKERIWKSTKRGVRYYEYDSGCYFIKYAHPAARIQDDFLYYGLIDAIQELIGDVKKKN